MTIDTTQLAALSDSDWATLQVAFAAEQSRRDTLATALGTVTTATTAYLAAGGQESAVTAAVTAAAATPDA